MTLDEVKEAIAVLSLDERTEFIKWFDDHHAQQVAAFQRERELELERKHRVGYQNKPVRKNEFSNFENEQVWPEES